MFTWYLLCALQTGGAASDDRAVTAVEAAAFMSPGLVETRISLPNNGSRLALRDLDGDGTLELLRFDSVGVAVRHLGPDGTYGVDEALLVWPSARVAWDLVPLYGDGRVSLLTVTDGKLVEARSWSPEGGAAPAGSAEGVGGGAAARGAGRWSEPALLLEEIAYLPWGITKAGLARDVDGDSRPDLVLPGSGYFRIRRNLGPAEEGGALRFEEPIQVAYEPEVDLQLGDPERLSSTFSQDLVVPWFRVEDVDGDGLLDLVSETEDRVAFHLARPKISTQPTWVLDLAALSGGRSNASVDLDDLLAFVSGTAQWRVGDIDGKQPNDLVIGSEGTFKVYFGGAETGPRESADQVLKISGNVLYFFLRDGLGDGRLDLQILRGERLSLGKLLRFLLIPGRIEFDLFTYEFLGNGFDRNPTQRSTLALRIPHLIGFAEDAKQLSKELEKQWDIPARRIDWDGDGAEDDVLDQRGGRIVVVRNCAPGRQRWEDLPTSNIDGLVERIILEDLDKAGDGGESVIDLGALDRFAMAPGAALRELAQGKEAVAEVALYGVTPERKLRGIDLDGDGRTDILCVGKDDTNTWRIQFVLRRD